MSGKLKIIPLGGVGEVGKNITAYESAGEILLVDCGVSFPEDELFGIDLVIPDFTWLRKYASRIRGMIVTHGHEDHIGAVAYFLKELSCPVYATRLTAGLLEVKLEEHGLLQKADVREVKAGQTVRCGIFEIELIHVNHSIADAVSLAIRTPQGLIIHTGDFKIDTTPVNGPMIDLARFGELGNEGVLVMLSDSTNAERPGYTMSERKVGESLDGLFRNCENRVIVTTFASNVHRLQQIIDTAARYGRKVAITGRSMENILRVAIQLDRIDIPQGTIIEVSQIKSLPKNKVCVVTTGSQGEPMSALYRMAYGAHRQIEVGAGDCIIISASPIPGNEKTIGNLINELLRRGCEVIYERLADIHVSGHACQEELKILLGLARPKYFMPLHGEYRMLKAHAALARQCGVGDKNVFLPELGRALEISPSGAKLGASVPAGRVFVEGDNVGDVDVNILHDRKTMAEDGVVIVALTMEGDGSRILSSPDIVTRGFLSAKDAETISSELRERAGLIVEQCINTGRTDWATIKARLRGELSDHVYRKTKRRPMILPFILEA